MTTKLHIDVSQGVVDVEGDPDLVREVYRDFRDQLLSKVSFASATPAPLPPASDGQADSEGAVAAKPKAKRRNTTKKKTVGDEGSTSVVADAPKLDKNLDTSGLGAFYGRFAPTKNADKILIFLKFMTETLGVDSPDTDQVYTCFKVTGEKIPKAFAQAFYDASTKFGYIDFRTSTDLPITIAGDNHFNHTLKKKSVE